MNIGNHMPSSGGLMANAEAQNTVKTAIDSNFFLNNDNTFILVVF
jgi:hypothetical protein